MGAINEIKSKKNEVKQPISSYLAIESKTQKSEVSIDVAPKAVAVEDNKKRNKNKKESNP